MGITHLRKKYVRGRLVVHLVISKVPRRELASQSGLLVKETIRGTSGELRRNSPG